MDEATLLQTLDTAEREGWTELDLRGCGLTSVPDQLCKLTNLRKLILTENKLTRLPDRLGDLVNLYYLEAGNNNLEVLPASITALPKLWMLGLGVNHLTAIPDDFGNLTTLGSLYLAHNHLSNIPDSIGDLTQLGLLGLHNNQLMTLPDSIGNLTQLRALGLNDNQLETLPESIANLTQLETLYLGQNQLRIFPDGLGESGKPVRRLMLSNNPLLTSLPASLNVEFLSVAGCTQLASLPEGIVVRRALDLADTRLTGLPDSLEHTALQWHRVPIDRRIAFHPETLIAEEILAEPNAERRRVMVERLGYASFLQQAQPVVLDSDRDAGGERRLLRIDFAGDEPLVCLDVRDPSTGRQYLLRIPPNITNCHQAAAWIAGFDNPDDYHPTQET